ncbi:MAG: hypothetical protein DIU77_010215, partial [Thermocrispum agreste]
LSAAYPALMEVIMWLHWVPLFVLIALIVVRVLVNLEDRPGAAESTALSATRGGAAVGKLRSAPPAAMSKLRSAARAVRNGSGEPGSTVLRRCSVACRASTFLSARCTASKRCPGPAR